MKTNNKTPIANKKKYLALLPFTVLGASAFISNPAQASYHCDRTENETSLNLTCNDTGTEKLDKIDISTDKKNFNLVVNSSESAILTDSSNSIDVESNYIPGSADDIGNLRVSLQRGSITASDVHRSVVDINSYKYSNKQIKTNIDVDLGKDFTINSQTYKAVLYTTGLNVYNGSRGNRNNVVIDGTVNIVNNSKFFTSLKGAALGVVNSLSASEDTPENEIHTTINENAKILVKGVKSGTGVSLGTSSVANTTSSKIFFTMNGGKIQTLGNEAVGLSAIVNDTVSRNNTNNYESNNSLVKLDLNAGDLYVRGGNSLDNDSGNLEHLSFIKSVGVKAIAKTVEINQAAQNSIQVTGRNSDALRLSGRNISLDLAGKITSDQNAIYIEDDTNSAIGLTTATINIQDGAKVIAGNRDQSSFVLYDSEGVSNTTIGKAKVNGSFYLAGGDDSLTLNGTDFSKIGTIDGGSGFDKVKLANYDEETYLEADQFRNLENITLDGSTFYLNGDELVVGKGSQGSNKGGLFLNNAILKLNSEANSRRKPQENLTISGDLHNLEGSVIDLRNDTNPNNFNTLTIDGDYYGGGSVIFNTQSGDDSSHSDKLVFNGNIYGNTKLLVKDKGGLGEATSDGIKIIEVAEDSVVEQEDNAFTLVDSIEAGAYEYNTLAYSKDTGKKGFYLQSKSTASSGSDERGDSSITIGKNTSVTEVLRPAVAGYVLAQQINAQALNDLNAGLHQRTGEQRAETNYINRNQSWVRTIGTKTTLDVNNLGSKNNHFGLQVGYDFKATHTDDLRNRAGVFASYSQINSTLTDSHRKEFHIPGRVATDLASLGVYHTTNLGNSYLDLVGSLHFLHNDYAIIKGGQQNAFGGNLSVEGGYNLDLGNNFFVEPQVQLSYQGTRYADFKDTNNTEIKGYTHQSLRPRLGLRLGYHDVKGTNLWLHANLETEVLKTAKLTIGNDLVSVDRAGKYLYDLGLNGQVALSPTTVLYGSAQYKGGFDKKTTLSTGEKVKNTKLKGFGGEVGLRFTW